MTMTITHKINRSLRLAARGFTRACLASSLLATPLLSQAQAPYATAELAGDAFIKAVVADDEKQMAVVLGKAWRELIPKGSVSSADAKSFIDKAKESRTVAAKDGHAELAVGKDAWVLPIPIVQGKDGQWRFDPQAGRQKILAYRIGANELAAMQATLAYVDAQRDYALADRNGDGMLEYAQKLASSKGKRDGLIWSQALGDESPLGEDYLTPSADGGYHGYHFKILTSQGPKANGGARSYLIGKRMVTGFALLAWPVKYGKTGVMSFMVNQEGVVYERDLGQQTPLTAKRTSVFNPEDGWAKAKP